MVEISGWLAKLYANVGAIPMGDAQSAECLGDATRRGPGKLTHLSNQREAEADAFPPPVKSRPRELFAVYVPVVRASRKLRTAPFVRRAISTPASHYFFRGMSRVRRDARGMGRCVL